MYGGLTFSWLKKYLPRSLYGRAALILIVPIVTIQLVVSIVFIQRHFEDVTRQMTGNVVRELVWLLARADAAADISQAQIALAALQDPLAFEVALPAAQAVVEGRRFYDLSGRVVISVLRQALPQVGAIDLLSDSHLVVLMAQTRHGPLRLEFARNRVSASNPHQLLVLMIATSLLMTVIAYLFLRNQLRPIRRLAQASEAFGKGQWLDYHPAGATEVRAAGGAFLAMRARIERQIEQRTMMLSGVSHDLRTPLTRLRLSLSLLPDDVETRDDIRAMGDDIDDMEHLINGFLNFARGDAADEIEDSDCRELAFLAIEKGARNGRDVRVGVMPSSDETPGKTGVNRGVVVRLRPRAVSRALDNLIGNALRYGGNAVVSVLVSARTICFRVEDSGPGIAPEHREEALKPFSRLEPARSQNRTSGGPDTGPGTGLGLAIAQDIARTHGGVLRPGFSCPEYCTNG